MLPHPIPSGGTVVLANAGGTVITVDFLEVENVPPPSTQPNGFLSITDSLCNGGAISLDSNQTGFVFDGTDDAGYASTFQFQAGVNPYANPVLGQGPAVNEKDYYINAPGDSLQDNAANQIAGGLSMFALADHNFASLSSCLAQVAQHPSQYRGVWIPPGRFYVRGNLSVNQVTIQGAGMWYSKFVAVDTAPPTAVTYKGVSGYAGRTGNLFFSSAGRWPSGSSNVHLSDFSMFGNVTQRDTVDQVSSNKAISGVFVDSTFDHIWIEHYAQGIWAGGNSSNVTYSFSRARDTFADGFDFYGTTSNSSITSCDARNNGDDGFAIGSAPYLSSSPVQQSSNQLVDSTGSLQWWGAGIAVYGGSGHLVSNDVVSDILNYPCLRATTLFVPPELAADNQMTDDTFTELDLHRCGGATANYVYGALKLGVAHEALSNLEFSQITIDNPAGAAISFTLDDSQTDITNEFSDLTFENITAVNNPNVAVDGVYVAQNRSGSGITFQNLCSCSSQSSVPQVMPISNHSRNFVVTGPSCSLLACPGS